jgi:hypothetical protein
MARKNSGRRLPIAGPKRTETTNPGQVNAPFQAPGAKAPAAPKKNVTKTDLGLSEFQRNLAAGKSVGDYETRGSIFDFGGDIGEMKSPTAISDNTAHIDALHSMANEASGRLIAIGKEHVAEQLGNGKVKANTSTFTAMGPATAALDKAKASFANAHLAHLAGDAISSTIHVKEGAQHLVNAVNHLESGDAWGAVNAKGNSTSSFRSWRADPTDGFKPLISLAGAFHTKVAAAVNGYTQHVMKAAEKKPEVSAQLDNADLSPVSYTPADSDTKSPLIKSAAPAAAPKELSPQEQALADSKAAALKSTNARSAQAAGTVKKEKVPAFNNFAQTYENAKKFAAKNIGKPDKSGKIYTQEMHDEEFAPLPKEEQPVVTPATPKTKPARNRGARGSELEDERVRNSTPFGNYDEEEEKSATTQSVFNSQILGHLGYNTPKEDREIAPEDNEPVEIPDEKIEEPSAEDLKAMMAPKSRKKSAAAPAPAAPVKEARYDVFNVASQAGK